MHTRRHMLVGTAALVAGSAFPAIAISATRDNPMPDELRKSLERDPNAPVLGNPKGDITLTEFFDYNCPFCREMIGTVHRVIAEDSNLRVVYREWPVFGEGSVFASRASLASLEQGKYWQLHEAMMRMKGPAEEASVMKIVKQLGLDEAKLRKDMEAANIDEHFDKSEALANHMGLMGTPTFVAGDEGAFGKISLEEVKGLISRAREILT